METENVALPKEFLPPIAHSKCFNVSQIVHIGPCLLCAVCMSADGVAADCDIYDGSDVNGELKGHLEALIGTTFGLCLGRPTDFDKGIYLHVNAKTTFVTIQWIPEDWHDFV